MERYGHLSEARYSIRRIESHVAPASSYLPIAFALKKRYELLAGNSGHFGHMALQSDQVQTNVLGFYRWRFFIFETQKSCFFYICERFFYCFTLAVASFQREIGYGIAAFLFFVEHYGKCSVLLHARIIP